MACAHGESVTFAAPRKSPDFRWVAGGLATRALVSTTGAEEGRRATRGKRHGGGRSSGCRFGWLVLVGCHDRQSETALQLWAMGREGEVVQRLVPEFERAHPGRAGARAADSVERGAREAAHRLRRRRDAGRLPGRQHVDPRARRARRARRRSTSASRRSAAVPRDDFFPASSTPTSIDGRTLRRARGTSTRACSSIAPTCSRAAGYAAPPRTWDDLGRRDDERIKQRAAARALRRAAADDRVGAARHPGARSAAPTLLRDGDRYGDFRSPAFRAAFDFYLDLFRRGLAPRAGAGAGRRTSTRTSPTATSPSTSRGPWNLGEFARRLPAAWPTRGRRRRCRRRDGDCPGVSLAGGASLAIVARLAARRTRRGSWIEFLAEPAQQLEFYRLTGDLPARQSAWRDAGLAATATRGGLLAAARSTCAPTPKIPEWERIARQDHRSTPRARDARRASTSTRRSPRSTATSTRILEKRRWMLRERGRRPARRGRLTRAGGSNPGAAASSRPRSAAIVVFFFVPVAASLLLSFTDFDIYAVAEPRQPALRRARATTAGCSHDPLFWMALRNTALLRAGRRRRCRSRSRSARRCC